MDIPIESNNTITMSCAHIIGGGRKFYLGGARYYYLHCVRAKILGPRPLNCGSLVPRPIPSFSMLHAAEKLGMGLGTGLA